MLPVSSDEVSLSSRPSLCKSCTPLSELLEVAPLSLDLISGEVIESSTSLCLGENVVGYDSGSDVAALAATRGGNMAGNVSVSDIVAVCCLAENSLLLVPLDLDGLCPCGNVAGYVVDVAAGCFLCCGTCCGNLAG